MASWIPAPSTPAEVREAAGASSSGSAGTVVATLEAAPGTKWPTWTLLGTSAATDGDWTATITYTDDSTETVSATVEEAVMAQRGCSIRLIDGGNQVQVGLADKDAKKIEAVTVGTGTAERRVSIQAIEVPV